MPFIFHFLAFSCVLAMHPWDLFLTRSNVLTASMTFGYVSGVPSFSATGCATVAVWGEKTFFLRGERGREGREGGGDRKKYHVQRLEGGREREGGVNP